MKNIINWNYERASWQWDLLCVLIMCFIFLTPKSWFNKNSGSAANQTAIQTVETTDLGREVPPQGR
jgi:hypothetical protein